jgi:hypothetical protein
MDEAFDNVFFWNRHNRDLGFGMGARIVVEGVTTTELQHLVRGADHLDGGATTSWESTGIAARFSFLLIDPEKLHDH